MPLTAQAALNKDQRAAPALMQHRHYATIAQIIRDMRDYLQGDSHARVIEHFANSLARTNTNFNRARFIAACDN